MPEDHFVQLTTAARVPSVDKKYARFKVSQVNSLMNEYTAIPRQRLWFSVPCSFIVTEERENRRFLFDNIQGGNQFTPNLCSCLETSNYFFMPLRTKDDKGKRRKASRSIYLHSFNI